MNTLETAGEVCMWVLVILIAGYSFGFKNATARGLSAVQQVEASTAKDVAFAQAARDVNGWKLIWGAEQ